jgi:hypothetical protein
MDITDAATNYFYKYNHITIDGIGRIEVEAAPPIYDVVAQRMVAQNDIAIIDKLDKNIDKEVNFIAKHFDLNNVEALKQYQFFCSEIKTKLNNGESIALFNTFELGKTNNTYTVKLLNSQSLFEDVAAKRVLRLNEKYEVTIGDNVALKNTQTAKHYDQETNAADRKWWLLPLLIAVICIAYCVYKFLGLEK